MTQHVIMTEPDLRRLMGDVIRQELRRLAEPSAEWLKVSDAAARKGVTPQTIYRQAKDGLIESRGGVGVRMEVKIEVSR